jgi:hypothetical protein
MSCGKYVVWVNDVVDLFNLLSYVINFSKLQLTILLLDYGIVTHDLEHGQSHD